MSSLMMLRSAIKTAATAAARRPPRLASTSTSMMVHKASLSTMTLEDSADCYLSRTVQSADAPSLIVPNKSNFVTSYLSKLMTSLSGHPTLVTMDYITRQLEENSVEEECWEDIISSTTTTKLAEAEGDALSSEELSLWQISTLKRRKKMMNKHKLRKRRKKMRLKTRK